MNRKISAATVPAERERVGDDQGDQADDGEDEQPHGAAIYPFRGPRRGRIGRRIGDRAGSGGHRGSGGRDELG